MNNITSPAIMKMNPRISWAVNSILIKELMAVKNKNLWLPPRLEGRGFPLP